MPNHVHALLTPLDGIPLAKVLQSLKAASSARVNTLIGSRGRLWQPDYYDRAIRNPDHFLGCARYTEWNPVKAGLVQDPVLWSWSSANENARARFELLCSERGAEPY
jgi:REP element-mobilizing transposase RayT